MQRPINGKRFGCHCDQKVETAWLALAMAHLDTTLGVLRYE